MTTLTVEEALAGLGRGAERAVAGEQIQIRKGDAVVEFRPTRLDHAVGAEELSPRKALRRLQEESCLTATQAEQYLREVHEEYLALEDRRLA